MASIFAHLLDTLPFAAGTSGALHANGTTNVDSLTGSQLRQFIRPFSKTGDYTVAAPPVPTDSVHARARVWSFKHRNAALTEISEVNCRSRETGYKLHRVMDLCKFGLDTGASGALRDNVQIVPGSQAVDLPLTSQYLHSKWVVTGGWMPAGFHHLWPLEMYLDYGVVLAFAYELAANNELLPYTPRSDDRSEAAMRELESGSTSEPFMSRALNGDFMPLTVERGSQMRAPVGESVTVSTSLPRVLVVVSFSCFRERNDFEPGGIVGMCKVFPHIMVRSSIQLQDVKATIRCDRPPQTQQLDQGDGTRPSSCCGSYPDIKSLLVTDSNENPLGPDDFFKPFWSGIFAYYEVDPEQRLGGQRLRVVDTSKNTRRTISDCGRRDVVQSPEELTDIEKVERQGEFDNLHIAPRLRLPATQLMIQFPLAGGDFGPQSETVPINPALMKLDPIVMAPFCSHDCFHFHWRWSSQETSSWVLGWSASGPHSQAGAPMVPLNQEVDIVIHSATSFSYHAHAHSVRGIPPLSWTTIMHHGGAYASGIVAWRERTARWLLAQLGMVRGAASSIVVQYFFLDAQGRLMTMQEHPALLYWLVRYYVDQNASRQYVAGEWLSISTGDVDRARRG
jgi:hypothetical protein